MDNVIRVIAASEGVVHAKSAFLSMATSLDSYRTESGWERVDSATWQLGKSVAEINQIGKHHIGEGTTLIVARIDKSVIAHFQVIEITMADAETLPDEVIAELGYETRQQYLDDWGYAFSGKVWLMKVARLTPQSQAETLTQ